MSQDIDDLLKQTTEADFLSQKEKDEIKADLQYLRESNERMRRFEEESAKINEKNERAMVFVLVILFIIVAFYFISRLSVQ